MGIRSGRRSPWLKMRIVDLRTGYQHNPLGIVCGKPCFSWRLESRRPETMQRSYRIEVASSPELLLAGRADKWDSSFIDGSACSGIEYAGIPLVGTERCHWRVSCRDERGRTWCSREEAWFECALTPEQWEADWIGCPAGCEGGLWCSAGRFRFTDRWYVLGFIWPDSDCMSCISMDESSGIAFWNLPGRIIPGGSCIPVLTPLQGCAPGKT